MKKKFNIESVLPEKENVIKRKLNREEFAKDLLWLIHQFRGLDLDLIYTKDYRRDFKVSSAYAHKRLVEFSELGMIKRIKPKGSNDVYFEPVFTKNSKHLKLSKYEKRAKKTLGVK